MLKTLSIRDFVIVERLSLEFQPGFTALTGETGAGKSILLDALALALGDRADPQAVRDGTERAEIEVEFDLSAAPAAAAWLREQALEGDDAQLILRRVIDRGGRTRAFINGRTTTLAQLREIGEQLVDIHGQHDHQLLLRPDVQRSVLDAQGGLEDAVQAVGEAWRQWQHWREARAALVREAGARAAERERLAWQLDELTRLDLAAGEWESLQADHGRLAHAAALIEGAEAALQAIDADEGGALAAVAAALTRLEALAGYDGTLAPLIDMLGSAQAQLQEAAHDLRRYAGRVDLDPQRLQGLERRLELVLDAARKLRVQPEALAGLRAEVASQLAALEETADDALLAEREAAAQAHYAQLAAQLSGARRRLALKLSGEVTGVMRELALGAARFEVGFAPIEGGSAFGNERVEFLVATNAGATPRPLGRVASGGELSRLSLAIQVVTSARASVPTLIFDEVDAGIGGAVADIVGRKLGELGAGRQVLCVTHLPQVAAQAGQQWTVAKRTEAGATRSEVRVLDPQARVEEISRMLGGAQITATTRKHAAELLASRAQQPRRPARATGR